MTDYALGNRYPDVRNFIGGVFDAADAELLDVTNPADGSVLSRVPLCGPSELDAAVGAAKEALPTCPQATMKDRVQVFYRFKALLERHLDELAALVTEENGKIESEA